MKKIYIAPETNTVLLNVSHHFCLGSTEGLLESVTTEETVNGDGDLLSRKGSLWDDEE